MRLRACQRGDAGVESVFRAQRERPSGLAEVDLATLTSDQRALVVNDGTVTDLVERLIGEPVVIEIFEQTPVLVDPVLARWLDLALASFALRRRIAIRGRRSGHPCAFAESLLVCSRLPPTFLGTLERSGRGIGEALTLLEHRRELLWFGLVSTPSWASAGASPPLSLVRGYRIVLDAAPVILISEHFPFAPAALAVAPKAVSSLP